MKQIQHSAPWLVALAVGIATFGFYQIAYWGHLHFTEQYQLFLFTSDYFWNLASVPGGLSAYAGRFVTQFFYYSITGAAAMGLLAALQCLVTQHVAARLGASAFWSNALAPLVPTAHIAFMCDEYSMLAGMVAPLIAAALSLPLPHIGNRAVRLAVTAIAIPACYWICGGAAVIFTVLALAYEYLRADRKHFAITAAAATLLLIVSPLIAYQFLAYPLHVLTIGIGTYRNPLVHPASQHIALACAVGAPVAAALLSKWQISSGIKSRISVAFSVAGVCTAWISAQANTQFEEPMRYDFWASTQQWDKIITDANRERPSMELSYTSLNLALAMRGQLLNTMFRYGQTSTEALLNTWKRDCTSALPISEVCYRLGMLNMALRYTVEAMEATTDYQKSGRMLTRMAEINMLNGQYAVARKYCKILANSLFYSRHAYDMMRMMDNPASIDKHREYGHLRRMRTQNDYMFNTNKFPNMTAELARHNHVNKPAMEYSLAWLLLDCDIDRIMNNLQLLQQMGYTEPPVAIQEAITLAAFMEYKQTGKSTINVPDFAQQRFGHFMTLANSDPKAAKSEFGNTYWHYYFFTRTDSNEK